MTKFPLIIRFHKYMSLGCIVTRPAWRAQMFTSSNIFTRKDSEASCKARMAVLWSRRVRVLSSSQTTSLTRRWKGSFRIKSSVDFWYFRIWRRATVPGRNRRGFLTFPVGGSPIFRPSGVLRYLPRPRTTCFVRVMITSRGCLIFFFGFYFRGNKKVNEEWENKGVTTQNNGVPGVES